MCELEVGAVSRGATSDGDRDIPRGRRFVLLDRDGTLIHERRYLSDPRQVELIDGAGEALGRLRALGLGTAIVTNQSGVGRGLFDEARLAQIHRRLVVLLAAAGGALDGIYVCPHVPEDDCPCRKPRPGLIERAQRELGLDPGASFVVGDKACDIELGKRVGAMTVLVRTGYGVSTLVEGQVRPDHAVRDVAEAARLIEAILATRAAAGGGDGVRH